MWDNPQELMTETILGFHDVIKRHPRDGWVRADQKETAREQFINTKLIERLSKIQSSLVDGAGENAIVLHPGANAEVPQVTLQGAMAEAETGETGEAIPEVGDNCEAGSYVIEAGDTTRFAVANKFDVTVDAMDAANASTNGYDAFYPGLSIVIPAKDDC